MANNNFPNFRDAASADSDLCVYLMACDSVGAARANIAQYFGWYSTERPHSSQDRTTPETTYQEFLPKLSEAA